jgi:hypothetical protein
MFLRERRQEKGAWLEAADGTRHNAIIRPSLI